MLEAGCVPEAGNLAVKVEECETIDLELDDEIATGLLAEDIALALKPGDCFALSGDLGAGKTTLIRAIIRAIALLPELEVPSPTFTLVQHYDLRIPIGHFDLYRVTDPGELSELGLDDILKDGAAFIEWPEMAQSELPTDLIKLTITEVHNHRLIKISGPCEFSARFARSVKIRNFLNDNNLVGASRMFFQGDASSRTYERIIHPHLNNQILMNMPKQSDSPIIFDGKTYPEIAHLAQDVIPFIAIAKFLRDIGLRVPQISHSSIEDGILIVEDLGAGQLVDHQNIPIVERYLSAIDVLACLHYQDPPSSIETDKDYKTGQRYTHKIPFYDQDVMQMEVKLLLDWYLPFRQINVTDISLQHQFIAIWQDLFDVVKQAETSLVLRDYHSPNIIWASGQNAYEQIGIIDFQDALIGPSAYDVASLAQDARVTISPELEAKLLRRYKSKRLIREQDFNVVKFDETYAIMAAQRAVKLLGIFVRLNERDGKNGYLQHIPRIEKYLARICYHRACCHNVLTPLRLWFERAGILKNT